MCVPALVKRCGWAQPQISHTHRVRHPVSAVCVRHAAGCTVAWLLLSHRGSSLGYNLSCMRPIRAGKKAGVVEESKELGCSSPTVLLGALGQVAWNLAHSLTSSSSPWSRCTSHKCSSQHFKKPHITDTQLRLESKREFMGPSD